MIWWHHKDKLILSKGYIDVIMTIDWCHHREWTSLLLKAISSNKLLRVETVSQRSRHKSNHTQKIIPSVVAGHQFLQFRYIGPDNGLFPTTVWYIQASVMRKSNSLFSKLFSSELLLQDLSMTLITSCVYWQSSYSRRLAKASPMLFGRIATCTTFTFQGRHCRQ